MEITAKATMTTTAPPAIAHRRKPWPGIGSLEDRGGVSLAFMWPRSSSVGRVRSDGGQRGIERSQRVLVRHQRADIAGHADAAGHQCLLRREVAAVDGRGRVVVL